MSCFLYRYVDICIWHTKFIYFIYIYIYIYIWNCFAFNKIKLCFPSVWLGFGFLTEYWVIRNHPLFRVTIHLKQLKVLDVLCSLCKVIGDLGFINCNQIYLLGINKRYSPLYNIYQFSRQSWSVWAGKLCQQIA